MKPPVLQPSPGLPVAVRWARDDRFWAVIGKCTDTVVFVKYVDQDHSTSDWVGDSMFVKEMPKEWVSLPAQLEIKAM